MASITEQEYKLMATLALHEKDEYYRERESQYRETASRVEADEHEAKREREAQVDFRESGSEMRFEFD